MTHIFLIIFVIEFSLFIEQKHDLSILLQVGWLYLTCHRSRSKLIIILDCSRWYTIENTHVFLHNWTLESSSCETLPSAICIIQRCIYKKIHYLTFDIGVPSTSCEVATSNGKRDALQEIHYLTLDKGSMSRKMFPSTLYIT